nr:MAG TPA: hypothetical protein [Bacteriophage sp.]
MRKKHAKTRNCLIFRQLQIRFGVEWRTVH